MVLPHFSRQSFYLIQVLLPVGLILLAWFWLRPKERESQFKTREADRNQNNSSRTRTPPNALADAKVKPPPQPLALSGISIHAAAHELLGVSENASKAEIQRAFREKMQQYHPDHIAAPGTQQWHDAQQIAIAIQKARETLLKKTKS